VLYSSRPEMLREAFSLVPEYLRSDVGDARGEGSDTHPDYMNYGVQLGRPFRALTLWMVLSTYGRQTMIQLMRAHMEWIAELAGSIDAHEDFERLAPTPLSTVCFRFRPGAGPTDTGCSLEPVEEDVWADTNEQLMARVNADGTTFLSHSRLRGRLTLRLTVGNVRTTRADVRQAWRLIQRIASDLPR